MHNFERIFNLVRKTGDKIVVTNEAGDDVFVIMPLTDYEKIIGGGEDVKNLSEQELWNKVDRDIAIWSANHQGEDYLSEPFDNEPLLWEEEENNFVTPGQRVEVGILAEEKNKQPDTDEDLNFEEKNETKFELDENDEDDEFDFDAWKDKTVGDALEYIEKQKENSTEDNLPKYNAEDKTSHRSRFSIPQERLVGSQSKKKDNLRDENMIEPIKYEDIPPPPAVNITDLMTENEPIIDASLENDFEGESEFLDE